MSAHIKIVRLLVGSGCLLAVLWIGYVLFYLSVSPALYLTENLYTGTPQHLIPRPVIRYYLLDTEWGEASLRHSTRYAIPAIVNMIPIVQSKKRNAKNISLALMLLRKLITLGKPINIKLEGFTALEEAIASNQPVLASFLIRHGASLKRQQLGKRAVPLVWAVYCNKRVYPKANVTPMLHVLEKAYHEQGARIDRKEAYAYAKRCHRRLDKHPIIFMDR